jgi:translocation and assembly module TamA
MKNLWRIILGLILLGICLNCWAELTLQNKFVGISGAMLKNVAARLNIKQDLAAKPLTIATIQRLNKEAPDDISKALQPYGYFKVQVTSRLSQVNNKWYAEYYINLGPPLRITKLDVKISGEAANDPKFKKFLTKFPIKQGDIFNSVTYNQVKQRLFSLAARRGYMAAKVEHSEVKIDLEKYTARMTLHFASGPRYYIGSIQFSKTPFSEKFLNKFLTIKPGEYYSSASIHKTQDNFNSSGLFQNVTVDSRLDQIKNLQVPIMVNVVPHKSKQANLGLGYGTDTGVRGSVGLDLYNLTSNGQHFTSQVSAASQKQAAFEANYIIPGKNPVTDRYDLSAGTMFEDDRVGFSNVIKGGPAYTTVIYGWQQTIRLNFQYEDWYFADQKDDRRHGIFLIPTITWLKRKANDDIRPIKGYRINLTVQGSADGVVSNVNFAQAQLDAKYMHPLYPGSILVLRGSLGYTAIKDQDQDKLPLSLWYTAGGADSVRGYSYKAIGPGTTLAVGSAEFRQKIFGHFYAALFYDAGNAGDQWFSHFEQGIGAGLVWLSPIGAIHLSAAKPTNEPVKHGKIQFSMGTEL